MYGRREKRAVRATSGRISGEQHHADVPGQEPVDRSFEGGHDRIIVHDVDVVLGQIEHRFVHREAVRVGEPSMHDQPTRGGPSGRQLGKDLPCGRDLATTLPIPGVHESSLNFMHERPGHLDVRIEPRDSLVAGVVVYGHLVETRKIFVAGIPPRHETAPSVDDDQLAVVALLEVGNVDLST